ncbi:hypothetical protein H206_02293, partial [Candidatus Electrothrix aarhusensis]
GRFGVDMAFLRFGLRCGFDEYVVILLGGRQSVLQAVESR